MKKTVLVVDDSASLRASVSIALQGAGYDVVEACDAQDGLQKLGAQRINLIISDVNMPGMDGIAFVRKLKEQAAYKFLPIIMLTTEGGELKKQQGKEAGAKAWMIKPFDPPKLIDAVSRLI